MDNFVHTTGDIIFIDVNLKGCLRNIKKIIWFYRNGWFALGDLLGTKTSSISKILKYKDDGNTELCYDYFRQCKEMNCSIDLVFIQVINIIDIELL